jgi:hypothetical protein
VRCRKRKAATRLSAALGTFCKLIAQLLPREAQIDIDVTPTKAVDAATAFRSLVALRELKAPCVMPLLKPENDPERLWDLRERTWTPEQRSSADAVAGCGSLARKAGAHPQQTRLALRRLHCA